MVYKTCLSQFYFTHAWSTGEGQVSEGSWGQGAYLHCTATTPLWNSLQAVNKWLCSLQLFPELFFFFFLTQVNDSWFSSGTPGRWATPVQKNACRLQVLMGWEQEGREGEPKGVGEAPPLGLSGLSEEEEKKKREVGDTLHDQEGPQFPSCSRDLSRSP